MEPYDLVQLDSQGVFVDVVRVLARVGYLLPEARGDLVRVKVIGKDVGALATGVGTLLTDVDAAPDGLDRRLVLDEQILGYLRSA